MRTRLPADAVQVLAITTVIAGMPAQIPDRATTVAAAAEQRLADRLLIATIEAATDA